jgi:3-methylcrotonyl-CoA carboxylase alpha subunit
MSTFRGTWRCGKTSTNIDVSLRGARLEGTLGDERVEAELLRSGPDEVVVREKGVATRAVVVRDGPRVLVAVDGETYVLERVEHGSGTPEPAAGDESFAVSPMTGTVAKVAAVPGERAGRGSALFVVEAMKMEYVVRAPRDVVVAEVRRRAGDRVALGDVVVTFGDAP